ncbi:metallophosphoesterase family protein [Devosia faecipullorum]|uniref:metallophosphoesterase family protein n=1 Tax=Devosia faecipullorum TaxID=2755039 RepID=UPI00187B298C|nr:metallophosphoesterase family protein [Devosia faecipullorum]MBE7731975.1 serine/threonine protein phosphatase [Devosia faecipullorum]
MLSGLRSLLGFGNAVERALPARQRLALDSAPAAIYAVGDVHGCLDQLLRLHETILADGADISGQKLILMLGDYVDRGPDSAETLDFLLEPLDDSFQRLCLCGNHDDMMLAHILDPQISSWLDYGGLETLASYGIDVLAYRDATLRQRKALVESHIPQSHLDFLANLPVLVTVPDAIFSHAGIRPDLPLNEQADADLMWVVHDYDASAYSGLPLVVHGHTPMPEPVVELHRICVDTGCFATGTLTAIRLQHGSEPKILAS